MRVTQTAFEHGVLQQLLQTTPQGVWLLDAEGRTADLNPAMCGLLGRAREEVLGRAAMAFFTGASRATLERELRARRQGATGVYEVDIVRPDGSVYRCLNHATPLSDEQGQPMGSVGLWTDLTAQRQSEQALHGYAFALNSISEAVSVVDRDGRYLLVNDAWCALTGLAREAVLGREVLDLGRIEAGHLGLRCEPVLLAPLAQECHALMRPLAEERGVRLGPPWGHGPAPSVGLAVLADRMRLKQVLLNLMANAIKYNHRGGEVELEVQPLPLPSGAGAPRLRIAVRDTGPGLDEAAHGRLFQPFERLGAELGGVEGTGIGLALSRGLVLAMGGGIGVDSRLGAGSRFWVELPQATMPAETAPLDAVAVADDLVAPPEAAHAHGATVLYVDDNPVNLVLMEAMLGLLPGLRLLSAETGPDGLRIARAERLRLVLLDIQLPGMDGFEVLKHLRADEATARTPVVAVSANAMPADIEAARVAGFTEYLTKPVDLARLHATVRRYLG